MIERIQINKAKICPSCQEPICAHGVCWCDDAEGACNACSDYEESVYRCQRNADFNKILGAMCGFDEEEEI